jgi:hypothetical protein
MATPVTRRAERLDLVLLEQAREAQAPTPADRLVRRMLQIGIAVVIAGVLIQAASGLVDVLALDDKYNQLNPDGEGNAFSWASASATFVAGFVSILLGLTGRYGRRVLVLGGILIFFSLDDTIRIHETGTYKAMAAITGVEHRLLWPMLWLPLLATAFLVLWTTAARAAAPARNLIRIGLVLLVCSVGLEISALPIQPEGAEIATWPYALEVVLEEGAELAGWILIALGLMTLLIRAVAAAGAPTVEGAPELAAVPARP